ncbi:MAG: hypothetical protein EBW82_04590 [Verrucomicrobia bacterium]|nr:hypothetical protein [Verrucomicrobiota bacterium]
MGDGAGLGEVGIGEEDADTVRLTGHGVVGNLLEFGGGFRVFEHGGVEAFLGGRDAQIAEEGCIVDPVEAGFSIGVMDGLTVGGENHEIALFPFDRPTAGFRTSRALKDEEELAGGESVGFECAFDNPDKIGKESRAGGGSGTLQLFADVERKNATGFLMKEIRGEGVVWNGRDQSREDGVRSRGVIVVERLFG